MTPDVKPYLLPKNHRTTMPSRIIYLDTETKTKPQGTDVLHRMDIAWACFVKQPRPLQYTGEQWRFFGDTRALCLWIQEKAHDDRPLWLFGHNIFFDLQVSDFFYYFRRWGWRLDFVHDKGLTFILATSRGKKRIKAVSSTNYYSTNLAALGEMLGLEKYEVDFDQVDRDALSVYCRRDVEILRVAMEHYFQFVVDNDLGQFSMTKSSQAFHAFRHSFMGARLYRHRNEKVVALERQAYFGGRTECFRFGQQPVDDYVSLDVNAMYPFVMKNYPMPTKLIDYQEQVLPCLLEQLVEKYCVIAEVEVETDEPSYAYRSKDKVIFPVGRFSTTLCTEGIKYALNRDHVRLVRQVAVYESHYIFGDYVDYLWQARKRYQRDGNRIMEVLCKYLMNSLYGKFGQKNRVEIREPDNEGYGYKRIETRDPVTHETLLEYWWLNTHVTQGEEVEGKNSMVSIPAHIAENARFVLYSIMCQVGLDRVYYCDTDSVKIREADIGRITHPVDDKALGALKVEGRFRHFVIHGNKHYITDTETKTKGVPSKSQKVGDHLYRYSQFGRLATHQVDGAERWFVVKQVTKHAPPMYDKGEVHPDGRITPFRYGPVPPPPAPLP